MFLLVYILMEIFEEITVIIKILKNLVSIKQEIRCLYISLNSIICF